VALVYALINFIGVVAMLKFFEDDTTAVDPDFKEEHVP